MDLGLSGRGYLLTGASRGLGFATAQALVDDGARVLVSSRSADGVAAAADRLGGAPGAFGTAADLADAGTADRLVAEGLERLGRIDGALLSVGGPPPGSALDVPEDAWRAGVESVLLGPLRLVKALVPHLADGAAIGFVLSTSVREPLGPPGHLQRAAARAGDDREGAGRRAGAARDPGVRPDAGDDRHRPDRRDRGCLR